MAAHSLTIARQMLAHIKERPYTEVDWAWLMGALNAPGWDSSLCIPAADHWGDLRRCITDKAEFELTSYLEQIIAALKPTHERFANFEEYRAAKMTFVKYGKPYWKKRAETWRAGKVQS